MSLRRGLLRIAVIVLFKWVMRPWLPPRFLRWWLNLISALTWPPRQPVPEPLALGGVPAQRFLARAEPSCCVLYLHGGGYNCGGFRSHRNICAHLARQLDAELYLVDYRLAPEHPFPAAVDDAFAAYRALLDAGHRRIVIAGDSAGGGLAFGVAVRIRDAGLPAPGAIVALSPWLDLSQDPGDASTPDDMISPAWAERARSWYLQGQAPEHPWASPLQASLGGLPPSLIQVARREMLVEQAGPMRDRLEAAGVPVELEIYDHVWHVFQTSAGQLPDADRALEAIGRFLRARLGQGGRQEAAA